MSRKSTISTSALLSSLATKTTKTTSKVPEMAVNNKLATMVDVVVKLKKEMKDAKTKYETVEAQLVSAVQPQYASTAADRHQIFSKSIKLVGNGSNKVMVSWSDSFSIIPMDCAGALRAADKQFDDHFVEQRTLTVKDTMTDDKSIAELVNLLGVKKFEKFFDIKLGLATKEGMDRMQFQLAEEVKCVLKQRAPSVKIIS